MNFFNTNTSPPIKGKGKVYPDLAMKQTRGGEVERQSFLTSEVDAVDSSTSQPNRLPLGNELDVH
jgi:hypothetical protein